MLLGKYNFVLRNLLGFIFRNLKRIEPISFDFNEWLRKELVFHGRGQLEVDEIITFPHSFRYTSGISIHHQIKGKWVKNFKLQSVKLP